MKFEGAFVKRAIFAVIGGGVAILVSALLSPKRGPKDGVVLIIRHAEKPDVGGGLSRKGLERAEAYKSYFASYMLGAEPLHLGAIYSSADTAESQRPRVTVQPLAESVHLPNDSRFTKNQTSELADELRTKQEGKQVLVCWHHGGIPSILRALGANPKGLLPDGEWPDGVYNWVIQLRFDHEGRVVSSSTKCFAAQVLPGD